MGIWDLEKTIKTNVKNANVFLESKPFRKDIYIEDGEIKIIRDEVRHSVFSGAYELDALGCYVVPTFVDSGCFALGSKTVNKELPKLNDREYKRFGFFSFITSLNILDKTERLLAQKQYVKSFKSIGMSARFLTGGLKDKAYHTSENIYKDIYSEENCVGAAVLYNDSYGSIDKKRLVKLCIQVEAAAYDKISSGAVFLFLGDLTLNLEMLFDLLREKPGREKTIIPWFVNRGQALLDSGIDYLKIGGCINLVAGVNKSDTDEDFIPLSEALIKIYEKRGSLDGVVASSFCGGYMPSTDENTMPQRGMIVNLYVEIRKAIEDGLPIFEAIKVLATNPIKIFDIQTRKIEVDSYANFLIIDKNLNIKYIIDGDKVINPDSFKNPVLFL